MRKRRAFSVEKVAEIYKAAYENRSHFTENQATKIVALVEALQQEEKDNQSSSKPVSFQSVTQDSQM